MKDYQNATLVEGQFGDWLRASNGRGASRTTNWGRKELAPWVEAKTQVVDNTPAAGKMETHSDSVQSERAVGEREG